MRGFIRVNAETDKKFFRIRLLRLDIIRRSSNLKELIWIKNNTEEKVNKVLPCKIFILTSFKEKVSLCKFTTDVDEF